MAASETKQDETDSDNEAIASAARDLDRELTDEERELIERWETAERDPRITVKELLDEIRRLDEQEPTRVTIPMMEEKGKYDPSTYKRRFGTWTTAVEEAGCRRLR